MKPPAARGGRAPPGPPSACGARLRRRGAARREPNELAPLAGPLPLPPRARNKEGEAEPTAGQTAEFGAMLNEVYLLYLGCQVAILLDIQYPGRFWTCFESWLAMRTREPPFLWPFMPFLCL